MDGVSARRSLPTLYKMPKQFLESMKDSGIKFLNNGYNLANGIIPNFAYLKSNKERIKGLFITHGHEDHIGGIPYLLEEVGYHFPV